MNIRQIKIGYIKEIQQLVGKIFVVCSQSAGCLFSFFVYKMKNKIRNENFVVIQGWMLNELELKGNDLMVYAIIYGFSQSENKCYNGSLQYLADWCNSSVNGIQKNLKNLVGKGFINKKEIYIKKVKFCEYTTKFDTIQLSCMGDIQQSCNNNIDNNINNKKENKKEKMKIASYTELKSAIKEDYLYKVASIYKLNKNTIYSLLDAFVNINKDKKSNEFKFCQHFENWLKTDKGQQAINNTRMTSNITNNYQQD